MGAVVFPAQAGESAAQTGSWKSQAGVPPEQAGEKISQKVFDGVRKKGPAANRWACN